MSPTVLWLIAGAVFVALEMFGIPGIGFLFVGIAALMVGGGIELGAIEPDAILVQFVLFGIISCISAALLWKRLKKARPPGYSNIVGTEAIVTGSGLSGAKEGQVKWSGTLMRAMLDQPAPLDIAPEGTYVIVRRVEGNVLYVTPKH